MKEINYSEGFLKVWEVYPRHVGKGAAFKAFQKLGCVNGDAEMIRRSVLIHVNYSNQWVRGFIPLLATYLNERRFEDCEVPCDEVCEHGFVNGECGECQRCQEDEA